jgi:hypothetical protein
MSRNSSSSRRPSRLLTLFASIAIVLTAIPASAAEKYGNSLDWVPANVAFYSSTLRLGEQLEIIANSNAWNRLTNMPAVQMAWQFIQMGLSQPGGPGDQLRQFFADPENQQLMELLHDGFAHEIVIYGDQQTSDFIRVVQDTMNAVRFGSITVHPDAEPENVPARAALAALDARRDRLAPPNLVVALKLTDTSRAKDQLVRLEKILEPLMDEEPQLKGRLKHTTVAKADFLNLELDGSLIPWDEVPWEEMANQPGQFDKLKAKLQSMKLTIAAGIRGDYLLLSVGASLEHLAALGSGKLLADIPEFKPLEKYAKERLTGISYASKPFLEAMGSVDRQIDQMTQMLRQVLPQAEVPEELRQRILKDVDELSADVKKALPIPGAAFEFSYLTARGGESYSYDWSQNPVIDGSKPLPLLDHVGGHPLLAVVGRSKYSPEQYDLLRKWIKKGFGYFEEFAVPQFSPDERQKYQQFSEAVAPLIQRLDKATGQMLLPGFADGQAAFVLDAKITSRQWFKGLPQHGRALPMIEPAIVLGVADETLVRNAFSEYQSIADAFVEKIKQIDPDAIPAGFTLPRPEVQTRAATGTGSATSNVYLYKVPKECGVDSQLALTTGLAKDVAVLSLAPSQAAELLSNIPLAASSDGPLADHSKPLAGACYFNWAGTVDAATPWVDFAVRSAASEAAGAGGAALFLTDAQPRAEEPAEQDDPTTQAILEQVHTVLDVLKCLRTVEVASYLENGAMVTHTRCEFQDAP